MCRSTISLRKFLKLLLEVELYKITIFVLFCLAGRAECSFNNILQTIMPFRDIDTGFIGGFLMYYLAIPFLNILVDNLDKQRHLLLMAYGIILYSVMQKFGFLLTLNYVAWFSVLHIVASYIRLYDLPRNNEMKFWGKATFCTILLAMMSVVGVRLLTGGCYWMVSDSNAPFAILVAVCSFMFFKNMRLPHSSLINSLAAGTFAVFLIHNNKLMREWLWHDVFQNCNFWESSVLIPHAIISVTVIFIVCTIIDYIRRKTIERPILDITVKFAMQWLPLKYKKVQ